MRKQQLEVEVEETPPPDGGSQRLKGGKEPEDTRLLRTETRLEEELVVLEELVGLLVLLGRAAQTGDEAGGWRLES